MKNSSSREAQAVSPAAAQTASSAPAHADSYAAAHADSYGSGRGLAVDEDSPFHELLALYSLSDQAQLAAFAGTSALFLQEVVRYLGLVHPRDEEPYEFASLAETVKRHREAQNGTTGSASSAPRAASSAPAAASTVPSAGTRGHSAGSSNHPAKPASMKSRRRAGGKKKLSRRERRILRREHKLASQCPPQPLPLFPDFRPTSSFDGWVHQNAGADDLCEFATLLGASIGSTYRHIASALTLVHGLPRFHQRCLDGDFTIEHVAVATRRCRDVAFEYLPVIDDYLAERRADITSETFARSLALKIAAVQPAIETLEKVSARRRVDIQTGDDGTAYLTLTGPAPELHAYYRRIEAFARAVYAGNTGSFGDQLKPGDEFDDTRGIDALMFDLATRTRPQLKLRITSHDTSSGETTSTDFPIDDLVARPDGAPCPSLESLADYIRRTFGADDSESDGSESDGSDEGIGTCTGGQSDAGTGCESTPGTGEEADAGRERAAEWGVPSGPEPCFQEMGPRTRIPGTRGCGSYQVLLELPTHEYWLSHQATTIITVPFLTLMRDTFGPAEREKMAVCDLAGMLPDGSPLPADMARKIAAHSKTWTRILTDPATGTPLDAKATSYAIPADVRRTLVAQWMTCTAPGCTRKAVTSEIDHIVPYDHDDPEQGGLTRFGNLHCFCKRHHQAKTDRKFSVQMTSPGCLEYVFSHGITTEVVPPDNPINAEQARILQKLFASSRDTTPVPHIAPVPQTESVPQTEATRQPGASKAERAAQEAPRIGERRTARTRPGPAPENGAPGWSEYVNPFKDPASGELREWFWDSGEPPPF